MLNKNLLRKLILLTSVGFSVSSFALDQATKNKVIEASKLSKPSKLNLRESF